MAQLIELNNEAQDILKRLCIDAWEFEKADDGGYTLYTSELLPGLIQNRILATMPNTWRVQFLSYDIACDAASPETPPNMVAHPPHYNTGKIEVIEFLEDQQLEGHEWNAVKYIARSKHKGKRVEDLEKAVWYLNRKLELLRAEQAGRKVVRPNEMAKESK